MITAIMGEVGNYVIGGLVLAIGAVGMYIRRLMGKAKRSKERAEQDNKWKAAIEERERDVRKIRELNEMVREKTKQEIVELKELTSEQKYTL